MRLVYFAKYQGHGTSLYRIYQYAQAMRELGIEYQIYPLFGGEYFELMRKNGLRKELCRAAYSFRQMAVRIRDLAQAGRSRDLIVIEHQLFPYFPPLLELWLRLLGRRFVVEFDDAIYLTPFHRRKLATILRWARHVIVGNRFLAEFARPYNPNLSIVPTVIDTDLYGPRTTYEDSPVPIIGWIGLPYNFPYLRGLGPALQRLRQRQPFILNVVSGQDFQLDGMEVRFRPWSYQTEPEEVRSFDIGIMPLEDTEWCRGKCGFKLLQYMGAGVPAVASPVGVNADILRDGENGYLAHTQEEWVEKLSRLCQDPGLRARIGRAARHTVKENYSLNIWAPKLAELFTSVANGP